MNFLRCLFKGIFNLQPAPESPYIIPILQIVSQFTHKYICLLCFSLLYKIDILV